MQTTVLLVDDNPDTLEMYALGLQLEGFATVQAQDGTHALAALATERPDCIVTDLRMPRMNGLEFRWLVGREHATAAIPVIALTGAVTPGEMEAARAAGFDSVLLKPCVPEILAREIQRVLVARRGTGARSSHAGVAPSDVSGDRTTTRARR